METKVCTQCGERKGIDQFPKSKRYRTGTTSICKTCNAARIAIWRKENRTSYNAKQKRSRESRIKAGKCRVCSNFPLEGKTVCLDHWITEVASKRLGVATRDVVEVLRNKLDAQNMRCPYTNEILIPGVNCELDHIIPVSIDKSLANSPFNTEWVLSRINRMKGNMTKDEFLATCRLIIAMDSGRPEGHARGGLTIPSAGVQVNPGMLAPDETRTNPECAGACHG